MPAESRPRSIVSQTIIRISGNGARLRNSAIVADAVEASVRCGTITLTANSRNRPAGGATPAASRVRRTLTTDDTDVESASSTPAQSMALRAFRSDIGGNHRSAALNSPRQIAVSAAFRYALSMTVGTVR